MHDADHLQMLSRLLEQFDGAIYRCRPDAEWTMVFVSAGVEALTGYRPDELVHNAAMSFERMTLPEDRPSTRAAVERACRGNGRFEMEYRIRRRDGTVRWVWERGTCVFDAAGRWVALDGYITDVTERKESQLALAEAERRFRELFDNVAEGIFQTTLDGRYQRANPALARLYGYDSPEQLVAELNADGSGLYVDPGTRRRFLREIESQGRVSNFESEVRRRDGRVIWITENARAVRDADGSIAYFEGTVEDITERKAYERRIAREALHDALTGLPNRALLNERIAEAIAAAAATGDRPAVMFFDLDNFKDINDTLGHDAGDQLIRRIGQRLVSCARRGDTVARIGGDEFVVLARNCPSATDTEQLAQRLLAAVVAPLALEGREITVSASLGVACHPEHGRDAATLMKHADAAMYEAKRAGRNTMRLFTEDLTLAVSRRLDLVGRLRRALERDEFELHLQPKVDVRRGEWIGAECLLRWHPADGVPVSPSEFIPAAENAGLIEPIGEWVLHAACRIAGSIERRIGRPLPLSVNVSPRQFRSTRLLQSVSAALAASGLAADRLELEITESCIADDTRRFVGTLRELKAMGLALSLDDFGTGYSSMAYLKDLPLDRLKIDRSFISAIGTTDASRAILRAIVGLAHNLHLRALAEGVETGRQHAFLEAIGCDEAQGWLFGRPMTADALVARLTRAADTPAEPATRAASAPEAHLPGDASPGATAATRPALT